MWSLAHGRVWHSSARRRGTRLRCSTAASPRHLNGRNPVRSLRTWPPLAAAPAARRETKKAELVCCRHWCQLHCQEVCNCDSPHKCRSHTPPHNGSVGLSHSDHLHQIETRLCKYRERETHSSSEATGGLHIHTEHAAALEANITAPTVAYAFAVITTRTPERCKTAKTDYE